MLRLGVITDVHFGPEAHHDGKLRKLSAQAPALTKAFASTMRDQVRPDFIVNLGDCIEDESAELDRKRYNACLDVLRTSERELINVAGNHDRVNLADADLLAAWRRDGELFYSFDHGGVHVVVLATHETQPTLDVGIDTAQLEWLQRDLDGTELPAVVLVHHSAVDMDLRGNRWFEGRDRRCLIQERARLRDIVQEKALLVLNGHLHWNHLAVIDGVPYLTLQSLIENLDDDAPGRAAAAYAIVTIDPPHVHVAIEGTETARYQFRR